MLPPPSSIQTPLVKLLTSHDYTAFQSHIATLAFFPNVFVKFLPPQWNAPTPLSPSKPNMNTAAAGTEGDEDRPLDGEDKIEWKKRIKMYCACARFCIEI